MSARRTITDVARNVMTNIGPGGLDGPDADRQRLARGFGAAILVILGVAILFAAGWVVYATWWSHGTICASGGGPATCRPDGVWASPASIVVGTVIALPIGVAGLLTLRQAVRLGRSS